MDDRHIRQTRLREIGAEGQRRIGAATAVVASRDVAAEIEARYLAGAGFGHIVASDAGSMAAARAVDPHTSVELASAVPNEHRTFLADEVTDASARAVAEGAYLALVALRDAVRRGAA